MSANQLQPAFRRFRIALLCVGYAWPIVVLAKLSTGGYGVSGGLALMTLIGVFPLIPTLVVAFLLPTFVSRLFVLPPVLFFAYFILVGLGGGSSVGRTIFYDWQAWLYALLWITTMTAIALSFPQRRSDPAPEGDGVS